jgi:hypothetical protein
MCIRTICLIVLVSVRLFAAERNIRVDLVCFAPSPYTHRHDSLRAGIGIYLSATKIVTDLRLPIVIKFYDASSYFDKAEYIRPILFNADVLVVGGSTWNQGSSFYLRRFFELFGGEPLSGVSASAWATAGGSHTGGEVVVEDTLRSLMGMGAQTFSLGQKLLVFTTDERLGIRPGYFTLLDCWYMDQFARATIVAALGAGDREKAKAVSQQLGYSSAYFYGMPKDEKILAQKFGRLQKMLNEASDMTTKSFSQIETLISKPN